MTTEEAVRIVRELKAWWVSQDAAVALETVLAAVEEAQRQLDRKDAGYTAIVKMERDARDQFRTRAEKAEAALEEAQVQVEANTFSREAFDTVCRERDEARASVEHERWLKEKQKDLRTRGERERDDAIEMHKTCHKQRDEARAEVERLTLVCLDLVDPEKALGVKL